MIQFSIATLPATLIAAAIIGGFGLIVKMYLTVNKMSWQIGTSMPPEGILGTIANLTLENKNLWNAITEVKDWMAHHGYERRQHK